jgi:RNA polymerase sigma-70 factor (ECF subfamily)
MTATLRPRSPWWDNLLALASSIDGATTSASGSPSGRSSDAPPSRPDADLLEMDPAAALAELTRRHADAVYRVALSVTRSHEMAEDVAQDALLKAWQALPSFRGDAPLKNWLLRITHNTAISALRRRRDVHLDPADIPEAPAPPHASVEARVEANISVEAFGDALRRLDDLSRSVVVLREVEGLSYEEIAQVLDVSLPTVKTRLLRARRTLAAALEGWQP